VAPRRERVIRHNQMATREIHDNNRIGKETINARSDASITMQEKAAENILARLLKVHPCTVTSESESFLRGVKDDDIEQQERENRRFKAYGNRNFSGRSMEYESRRLKRVNSIRI